MKTTLPPTEISPKKVHLFIASVFYTIKANWQWSLKNDEVICSDVIQNITDSQSYFEHTTKTLIHPDDLQLIKNELANIKAGSCTEINFRVITTYGEVINIQASGNIALEEDESLTEELLCTSASQNKLTDLKVKKNILHLQAQQQINDQLERVHDCGTWYYNISTEEVWYSDNIFRLHGLVPNTLNAHLNTFQSFIHPEDKPTVMEAADKAYTEEAPLTIQYRILKNNTDIRYVQSSFFWFNNQKGERILSGILKDISEEIKLENDILYAENEALMTQKLLQQAEQKIKFGTWKVSLFTRKATFSNNTYKLLGLKPLSVPASIALLLRFVHADDRQLMDEAFKNMFQAHQPPEADFRIVRPDGKLRYMRLNSTTAINSNSEIYLQGTIYDITEQAIQDAKNTELNNSIRMQNFVHTQSEEVAGIGTWAWQLDSDEITWSDSFYNLLGFKPSAIDLTIKRFTTYIHPEDKKLFTEKITQTTEDLTENRFEFRLLYKSDIKYCRAIFKILMHDDKQFFIGTIQDITSDYLLKQQLSERVQFIEQLSDTIPSSMIVTNTENAIIAWNRRCEDTTKIAKEDAFDKNLFDVVPAFNNQQGINIASKAIDGETVYISQIKNILTKGYHELFASPIKDNNDKVIGVLYVLHDVTEQVELRQQIEDRLSFIEGLVEASVDNIIALDKDMNYMIWNKKSEAFYHIKKEDVLGKNILEVFPNFKNDPSYTHFKKALKGETVHLPASASIDGYFAETFLIPIKNDQNEVSAVLWIVHDLTKEYTLFEEHSKANALLNNINEAYLSFDENGVLKYINRKAEELWRLPKETILNKRANELQQQFIDDTSYAVITEAIKDKVALQKEYFSQSLQSWIYISATPTEKGLIVLLNDINDKKETSRKLIKEHQRLLEAQSIGHIGNFEWDPKTNNILWSDELYRIYGLIPQETPINTNTLIAYTHPEDREELKESFEAIIHKQQPFSLMHRIVLANGDIRFINRRAYASTNEAGDTDVVYGTVQDVTELKKAELEIKKLYTSLEQKNKQLNEKNNELTTFTFVASHDLKEPLRRILTFSNWLIENEQDQLSQKGQSFLQKLTSSVKRMGYMLQDIEILLQVYSQEIKATQINLNTLLQKVKEDLSTEIAETNATVESEDLPVVMGDYTMYYYLFYNLISNGIKFCKNDNAPVVVVKSAIALGSEIPDAMQNEGTSYLKLSFIDNGIGFPLNQSKKIFEIFRRLHTDNEYKGTGIGLTICQKIIERCDGYITLESIVNKGSSFHCYLPIVQEQIVEENKIAAFIANNN